MNILQYANSALMKQVSYVDIVVVNCPIVISFVADIKLPNASLNKALLKYEQVYVLVTRLESLFA